MIEGPQSGPSGLKRCDDEFLVFDGDAHALSGLKAGGLDHRSASFIHGKVAGCLRR